MGATATVGSASSTSEWLVVAASVGIVAVLIALVFVLAWLVRPRGSDDSDGGGGGGPPRPPDRPPPGPPWWPAFERDFADYVARRGSRPPDPLMRRR
jgi:hypothetical protein